MDGICHHCKKSVSTDSSKTVKFRDTCLHCGSDLHICLNCKHYDAGSHHECRESSAEWVRNKERVNRCEYFSINTGAQDSGTDAKSAALNALNKLFS